MSNLSARIRRLEDTLGHLPCTCPDNAGLSWPGRTPDTTCTSCGGTRFIYVLPRHPGPAEALVRQALPILQKAYGGQPRADLTTLSDREFEQLKTALKAVAGAV